MVALNRDQAIRLSRELRSLRETTWPDVELTQVQLAQALSVEGRVAPATLSSWESGTNPKTPSAARLSAYARFFCSERSLNEGEPRLIAEADLQPDELDRYRDLEERLFELLNPDEGRLRSFKFDAGPVIVICPTMPKDLQGSLANEKDVNFTELRKYGDLDALIELFGFLRAENPDLDVVYRLPGDVKSDEFASHVVLLGGIGWNSVTLRFQRAISQVPITQVAVPDLVDGDIFVVESNDEKRSYYPQFDDYGEGKELTSDVGFVARLRNPFKLNRTLTICNGIFSRGVVGAVRCLTDKSVRDENERYIADRFPAGEFALLIRIRVVANETLSPDLQDPTSILYEWSPSQDRGSL
jgi:hypothetical protein